MILMLGLIVVMFVIESDKIDSICKTVYNSTDMVIIACRRGTGGVFPVYYI